MSQTKAQLLEPTGVFTLTNQLVGVGATFSGNVSIGGTLTKQDVTNVDSVGLITARSGIKVTGGNVELAQGAGTGYYQITQTSGNTVKFGIVSGSNIELSGTSNNAMQFKTNNTERLRITGGGFVQIGDDTVDAEAPLHVTAENSQGINAIFGAKDFIVDDQYNYDDANIALQGRDKDNNETGAGVQFTVRNTGNNNWIHGAFVLDRDSNYRLYRGVGNTDGTERLRIDSNGYIISGHTTRDANIASGTAGRMQLWGTSWADAGLALINTQAASDPAFLSFAKSRKATAGAAAAVVQNGDRLGEMRFAGDDGTDMHSYGAAIAVYVDGTPGSNDMPGKIVFATTADGDASSTTRLEINAAGNVIASNDIQDSKGEVRAIPRELKGSAYTLVLGDAGKCIAISSGGITVPHNVLGTGHAVTIINNSGTDQTITQAASLSMYYTADQSTGNRTLAGRGMATIWFSSGAEAYITGSGLS